jgi:hypothetical protein
MIDRKRPSTSDDVPAGSVNHDVAVTLSATDMGSGVDKTHFTRGANPANPTTSSAVYDPAHRPVLHNGERIKYFSTDTAGNSEAVKTSAAAKVLPTNTGPPSLPAAGKVGDRVTCKRGAWTGPPTSFAFSWTLDGSILAGKHASTYTLAAGDATHRIRCRVVARNSAGRSAPATSNALTVKKPPSTCKDVVRPQSVLEKHRYRSKERKLELGGSAADKPCEGKPGRVVRVLVTVSRQLAGGCRFLLEDGHSFGPLRKCDGKPPIVFQANGGRNWVLNLRAVLPAGRYTIRSRATDKSGNTERIRRQGKNVFVLD